MRALIWVVVLFFLAVLASLLIGYNWGYVQFVLPLDNEWFRVQMSLKPFVALTVVAFIVVYLLVQLLRGAVSLPEVVGQWRERRRRQRADKSLREALLTFHEGRYAQSLKFAEKAYAASDHPVTAVLLAARAAHALHDDERYRRWIERLTEEGEPARVARLMTEAELAIRSHDFDEAEQKLAALGQDGRHIAALRLSLRVAAALKHWDDVLKLTRQLRKHKALTDEQARPLLCRANVERLRAQVDDGEALAEAWNAIPAVEREDPELVTQAVPLFAHSGKGLVIRRTLERLLDHEWDSHLASLYGACGGEEQTCLKRAEDWLKAHPRDPGLLFALGRLCFATQLWGKAESYYTASLNLKPSTETHLALARLYERVNRSDDAQKQYRAAAEMAAKV
ncbi:MAG: heme biosynthesis protein HemY [Azoarcus sp.]|jgi:HemY protein|nr:heme biosynthesis protein HemY [Azoarcus sp.]